MKYETHQEETCRKLKLGIAWKHAETRRRSHIAVDKSVPMASPGGSPGGFLCLRELFLFVFLASFCISIGSALPSQDLRTAPEDGRRGWLATFLQRGNYGSSPSLQQAGDTEQTSPSQGMLTDAVPSEALPGALPDSQIGTESQSKLLQEADDTNSHESKIESPQRDLQSAKTHDEMRLSEAERAEQRQEEFPLGGSDLELELEDREQEQEAAFDPSLLFGKDHRSRRKGEEKSGHDRIDNKEQDQEPLDLRVPYLLGPSIAGWDEQRAEWQTDYPQWKSTVGTKPRVLIVSGSFPIRCPNRVADHIHIKALKQKMDYARLHGYDFYYNFAYMDPLFILYWAKLPLLRKLMLAHPETEWFFWVDSDAVLTDVLFEPPWDAYKDYNLVTWGSMDDLLQNKSSKAVSDSAFLIRNSQWSLDLMDKWSPFGPDHLRDVYGKMLSAFLTGRTEGAPSDPQSALAYLILSEETIRSKVKLVDSSEYMLNAHWMDVQDTFEDSMSKFHPGLGDWRWPWVIHFSGCHLCSADQDVKFHKCLRAYERALHFADNQVLAYIGFEHESLSSWNLTRVVAETAEINLGLLEVNPWAERKAQVAAAAKVERLTA